MKIIVSLFLALCVVACGRNAFLTKSGSRSIQGIGQADDDDCFTKTESIKEVSSRFKDVAKPFLFRSIKKGQYTRTLQDDGISKKSVKDAQVVLSYDLSSLNQYAHQIESVHMKIRGSQITKKMAYRQKAQICHNYNLLCSGNKDSVQGHIAGNGYSWSDESFTNTIEVINAAYGSKYNYKDIDINFDMKKLFDLDTHNTLLSDLNSDYNVFIADDLLIDSADLFVSYKVCKASGYWLTPSLKSHILK